ncbi:MAG TPA: hypothetical protein VIR27_18625 [Mycobacteriales bacterium]
MRLTHSSAVRGLAIVSAGAALFASAMVGTMQVANASTDHLAASAQSSMVDLAANQTPLTENGTDAESGAENGSEYDHGTENGTEAESATDNGTEAESGEENSTEAESGEESGNRPDGDHHGKKDHGKKDHGKKDHCKKDDGQQADDSASAESDDSSSEDWGRKSHCHMPRGAVESGHGGAALAADQSSVAPISLGVLSIVMLGAGAWMLVRTRRIADRSTR